MIGSLTQSSRTVSMIGSLTRTDTHTHYLHYTRTRRYANYTAYTIFTHNTIGAHCMHCTTHTTLHYATLQTLHTLHYATLRYTTLRYATLQTLHTQCFTRGKGACTILVVPLARPTRTSHSHAPLARRTLAPL
jgi:hypothetical protein